MFQCRELRKLFKKDGNKFETNDCLKKHKTFFKRKSFTIGTTLKGKWNSLLHNYIFFYTCYKNNKPLKSY